jgi:hypothetical protein
MSDWREPTEAEVERGPLVGGLTFWQALLHAGMSGETKPLADFIGDPKARRTITANGWLAVTDYIESLGKTRTAGNPHNPPPDMEVRDAAHSVDEQKRRWREQNGKLHVPPDVADGFIQDAIDRIAERRGVVIAAHSGPRVNLERWIRTALKAHRF